MRHLPVVVLFVHRQLQVILDVGITQARRRDRQRMPWAEGQESRMHLAAATDAVKYDC